MDTGSADRLHEILKREHAAYEDLRGVLLQQQQALRRFDAAGLDNLRQRGDVLAERIAELESARKALTGSDVRVTKLAQDLPEPQRSRLVAMAMGLRKLAEEVASIGRINYAATQSMLNNFHSVYRMLAGINEQATYGASGKTCQASGKAFLVDAVA